MKLDEFITLMSESHGIYKCDVKVFLKAFQESVVDVVASGDSIRFLDFGIFKPEIQKARWARDVQAGKPVWVPERTWPVFKPSDTFRQEVNDRLGKK